MGNRFVHTALTLFGATLVSLSISGAVAFDGNYPLHESYKKCTDESQGQYCFDIAYAYEQGQQDLKQDQAQALEYYLKACELKDGNGCRHSALI